MVRTRAERRHHNVRLKKIRSKYRNAGYVRGRLVFVFTRHVVFPVGCVVISVLIMVHGCRKYAPERDIRIEE